MNRNTITNVIEKSIDTLFIEDAKILTKEYNVHERTITHRLAMNLRPYFESKDDGLKVDIEYNRMRTKDGYVDIKPLMSKKMNWNPSKENDDIVYPDIIVHKRDSDQNHIVIEVKKAWKNDKKENDYLKINAYMEELHYEYGIYIELAESRDNCIIEFGPFDTEKLQSHSPETNE